MNDRKVFKIAALLNLINRAEPLTSIERRRYTGRFLITEWPRKFAAVVIILEFVSEERNFPRVWYGIGGVKCNRSSCAMKCFSSYVGSR